MTIAKDTGKKSSMPRKNSFGKVVSRFDASRHKNDVDLEQDIENGVETKMSRSRVIELKEP